MLDDQVAAEIFRFLPFCATAPAEFLSELRTHAVKMSFSKGQQILHEEDRCNYLPIVIAGDLRVYRTHSSGREITLYHINRGETCFLTMHCIFLDQTFPAAARAEEYTEALMVEARSMQRWREKYPFWQKYVFEMGAQRLISVISVLSDIAFTRMDERVAHFLLAHGGDQANSDLHLTHQDIANELGTAREVVTRVLRALEDDGAIRISRGTLTVIDPALLKKSR